VLLDVPRELGSTRAAGRAGPAPDRVEAAGDGFHDRVMRGYRALAVADPAHWVVVDGTAPADDVEAAVWKSVVARCPDLAGDAGDGGNP
jgi:dTMP kinase